MLTWDKLKVAWLKISSNNVMDKIDGVFAEKQVMSCVACTFLHVFRD